VNRLQLPAAVVCSELSPLEPERSVPVSGFSSELRSAPDVARFRFAFALRGDAIAPVHVMYSESLRTAEIKTGDMKAFRLADVDSVEQARERWVAWWRAGARKPAFVPPRRTGRVPYLAARSETPADFTPS
jgi:hypothetical protein